MCSFIHFTSKWWHFDITQYERLSKSLALFPSKSCICPVAEKLRNLTTALKSALELMPEAIPVNPALCEHLVIQTGVSKVAKHNASYITPLCAFTMLTKWAVRFGWFFLSKPFITGVSSQCWICSERPIQLLQRTIGLRAETQESSNEHKTQGFLFLKWTTNKSLRMRNECIPKLDCSRAGFSLMHKYTLLEKTESNAKKLKPKVTG